MSTIRLPLEILMDVKWVCHKCGSDNWDNFAETSAPSCGVCDSTGNAWEDLLTPEQMEEMNHLKAGWEGEEE